MKNVEIIFFSKKKFVYYRSACLWHLRCSWCCWSTFKLYCSRKQPSLVSTRLNGHCLERTNDASKGRISFLLGLNCHFSCAVNQNQALTCNIGLTSYVSSRDRSMYTLSNCR